MNSFLSRGGAQGIQCRKLNKATQKDHFPLPFIDEMLERLANHSFCYLERREKAYYNAKLYKKEPKDGRTSESRPSNSSWLIRYFSLTLAFICSIMVSFVVSGKATT
jgi:hypothetical protein